MKTLTVRIHDISAVKLGLANVIYEPVLVLLQNSVTSYWPTDTLTEGKQLGCVSQDAIELTMSESHDYCSNGKEEEASIPIVPTIKSRL